MTTKCLHWILPWRETVAGVSHVCGSASTEQRSLLRPVLGNLLTKVHVDLCLGIGSRNWPPCSIPSPCYYLVLAFSLLISTSSVMPPPPSYGSSYRHGSHVFWMVLLQHAGSQSARVHFMPLFRVVYALPKAVWSALNIF